MKNSIINFRFITTGYGHYLVIYTNPNSGKSYKKTIDDMRLIDATKNSDKPTQLALAQLKRTVKN